ncbi:MAG: hypothetical protein M1820_000794 [Bogoriella megaspora]|nr:MAG: hypothetical protein M1820_000794 [Bogoriella megaspora]
MDDFAAIRCLFNNESNLVPAYGGHAAEPRGTAVGSAKNGPGSRQPSIARSQREPIHFVPQASAQDLSKTQAIPTIDKQISNQAILQCLPVNNPFPIQENDVFVTKTSSLLPRIKLMCEATEQQECTDTRDVSYPTPDRTPSSQASSSFDSKRKGFAMLAKYGWTPDSNRGLGVTEQGIASPIEVKLKNDTLGIGVDESGVKATKQSQGGKTMRATTMRMRGQRVEKAQKHSLREAQKREQVKQNMLNDIFYGNLNPDQYFNRFGIPKSI